MDLNEDWTMNNVKQNVYALGVVVEAAVCKNEGIRLSRYDDV